MSGNVYRVKKKICVCSSQKASYSIIENDFMLLKYKVGIFC